ncbi:DUF4303 domain-containing protein [Paenibacillus macquariensis]|uniref:SMI1-KNR4 cell-wall n=1 Tax=Paenibacillus macquariensis TaxID=948756 RepID=A0ABY1JV86_9BACL|nr:DUF4303 domain-containing protein [Paenibacillus macquariensis]MEC0090810.1 DUF4303 domain-containing protein [Paenibacillus macquariensis]OAB34550.1 hypothetical protein PMSM_11850 [Paenibacillus macquariensis subsp. macquariensis]SIQ83156.1 SMI1-KNR4 cell-wall [Paenibacillus macquariensis]
MKDKDLDFKQLWNERKEDFKGPIFAEEEKLQYEKNLQYKLPQSYISLLQNTQNGGLLKRNCFPIYDEHQNVKHLFICSYISSICELESEKERKAYPGLVNLPDIGIYFGENLDAARTERFVFDYSQCTAKDEPRVTFVKHIYPVGYEKIVLANSFKEFLDKLIRTPTSNPFDYDEIKKQIKSATRTTFTSMVKLYEQEEIIAFGLYLDSNATMVCPAMNTKDFLKQVVEKDPKEHEFYKYETTEWKYEGEHPEQFNVVCETMVKHVTLLSSISKVSQFRNKMVEICIQVLEELNTELFFSQICERDILLMINISNGELSGQKKKQIISRLR